MAVRHETVARGGDVLPRLLALVGLNDNRVDLACDDGDGLVTWTAIHPRWGWLIGRSPIDDPSVVVELVTVPCGHLQRLAEALDAALKQLARDHPDVETGD
jgi:hypothetical protein